MRLSAPARLRTLALLVSVLVAASAAGCGSRESGGQTVVLYGFSIMENVMKDEIIPAFQDHWKESKGRDVRVITSFAGSGTITNQITFGAPAQVALVATEMDALNIRNAGLTETDWSAFKDQGTYAHTITCIVTRKDNPKGIHDFADMALPGVDVVYPDPTTSGGAQWGILALHGSALKTSPQPEEARQRARDLLRLVTLNAGSLPDSARRTLT